MNWVWTWGGTCFGYLDGDDLITHDGRHVGRKNDDGDIYSPKGRYLGEVRNKNRLITNRAKKSWVGYAFAPYARRVGFVRYVNYVGYVMYAGFEDFPSPEQFK
jgi:hypothetical protein